MRRTLIVAATLAIMAVATSCARGAAAVPLADSASARRLSGIWDVQLRIDRLGFVALPSDSGRRHEATGAVALVTNDWLDASSNSRPMDYGTYSIDFGRLGFDPRRAGRMPTMTASLRAPDSVVLVLEPDDDVESVRLNGTWRGDSIVGRWSLEPSHAGGDAAGSFTLIRSIRP